MIDTLQSLGKRTERLMYFGAILSVICVCLYIVSFSAENAKKETLADTLESVLICLNEDKMSGISKNYETIERSRNILKSETGISSEKILGISYIFNLASCQNIKTRELFGPLNLYQEITDHIDKNQNLTPYKIRENLEAWSISLRSQPSRFYEIEIPSEIAIEISGNKITSPLTAIFSILRLALIPIIIIWAAGLFQTRNHELQIIRALTTDPATSYAKIFPHILNSFPIITDGPRTKKTPKTKHIIAINSIVRSVSAIAIVGCPTLLFPFLLLQFLTENPGILNSIIFFPSTFIILTIGMFIIAQEGFDVAAEIVFIKRKHATSYHP